MKSQIPVFCLSLLLGSGAIAPIATAKPPGNMARPAGSTVLPTRIVNPVPASGSTFSSGAIGPDVNSQIPITGGFMAGDAAFFKHYVDLSYEALWAMYMGYPFRFPIFDPPVLFDVAVRNLRIETPRGITTTSRFIPVSSRFTDTNRNSIPDQGDTGQLQGVLSGVAFLPSGVPVFFQGVPTSLSFTLNSFVPTETQWGVFIKPRDDTSNAPSFFMGQYGSLSASASQTYTTREGFLSIGAFTADLNGDVINLPSTLEFRPVSDVVDLPLPNLGQHIRFEIQGEGVLPTSIYPSSYVSSSIGGGGNYDISTGTTFFRVQTISSTGVPEFQVDGTLGTAGIGLRNISELRSNDALINGEAINYRVQGEQRGYSTLLRNEDSGTTQLGLNGIADSNVNFWFTQGNRRLEGTSRRAILFLEQRNSNAFGTNLVPITGLRSPIPPYSITPLVPTGASLPPATLSGRVLSNLVTGAPVTYTNAVATYINRFTFPLEPRTASSNSGESTYTLYRPQGPVPVEVQWLDGDRLILVERQTGVTAPVGQGRIVAAYQMVGLPSRVFPGLMGIRPIPTAQVQRLTSPQPIAPPNPVTGTSP